MKRKLFKRLVTGLLCGTLCLGNLPLVWAGTDSVEIQEDSLEDSVEDSDPEDFDSEDFMEDSDSMVDSTEETVAVEEETQDLDLEEELEALGISESLVEEMTQNQEDRTYGTTGIYSNTWYDIPNDSSGPTSRTWREGMVSGNGENGVITSGAPYTDTMIFQYMYFNFPSADPITAPEDEYTYLDEARQAVFNQDASWNVHGRTRTCYYAFHPGGQLSLTMADQSDVWDYERWTNYETAEVGVDYTNAQGSWERRTFTSREDNVTITSIQSSSSGEKINMTLSVDDISSMCKTNSDSVSKVSSLRYKKLVADDCSYIGEVVKYPVYANSDLKQGGYSTITYVVVEGGTKERVVLEDSDDSSRYLKESSINVGEDKNPAIQITDATSVYLVTKSNRDAQMCNYSDFAGLTDYSLVDTLVEETRAVAQNPDYLNEDGTFSYQKALEPHAKLHGEQFNSAKFTLDGDEEDQLLSTEDLLEKQKSDKSTLNHALLERAWYAGRYSQLCASGICAYRLCGMWTGEFHGAWRYIFTMDANVNLQVSAMNTNHMTYGAQGYITYFLRLADDFMVNAKCSYNMHDALQVSVNSDGDHAQAVEYDRSYPFQYWNAGASWCLLPIYEYWQCYGNQKIPISDLVDYYDLESVLSMKDEDGDGYYEPLTDSEMDAMLSKGYLDLESEILLPLLTKMANFWDQIVTPEYYMDANGKACYKKGKTALGIGEKYMIIPCFSPENSPLGYNSTITANSTMDIAAARDGLKMVIALENAVKRDGYEQAMEKWENLSSLLPDYTYDNTESGQGALREWSMSEEDGYLENNNHRHVSHLYVAWPAYETKESEELKAGTIQSLINRDKYNTGDATTGHGWIHRALVYARVEDGDGAIESLKPLVTSNIFYSSMMTDHNSDRGSDAYCTDTSMGLVGTINEMTLFSNTGQIQLCPAIPTDWTSGSMDGLMARTQAEVKSLSWNQTQGRVSAEICSAIDQTITLTCGLDWKQAVVTGGNALIRNGESISLVMKAGETVSIEFYNDQADKTTLLAAYEEAVAKLGSHSLEDANYIEKANQNFQKILTAVKKVLDDQNADTAAIRKAATKLKEGEEIFDAAYDDSLSLGLSPGIYTGKAYFRVNYSGSDSLEVRYTVDGSQPAKDSPILYTRRLLPKGISVIKAALFIKDTGVQVGEVVSGRYGYFPDKNLVKGKSVTSSLPDYGTSLNPSKALDGNSSTRWAVKGNYDTYDMEIDLGEETTLNSLYMDEYAEVADAEKCRIQSFQLYALVNGSYQQIASFEENTQKEDQMVVYDTTLSGHAKYAINFDEVTTNKIKVEFQATKEISIWEFQLYSRKSSVSVTEIEKAVETAKAKTQEDYTNASWAKLETAVEEALSGIENGVESKEQADSLIEAVKDAIDRLEKQTYRVTLKGAGSTTIQTVEKGGKVKQPKNPKRKNYLFVGWYAGSKKYNFKSKVTSDLTLQAKWKKVQVGKGKIVSLTGKKSGTCKVKAKKVSKADGYEFTYYTGKNTKKNQKTVTSKTCVVTLKNLNKKKTYYIKVRAYRYDSTGKKVYGSYSKVKTFH